MLPVLTSALVAFELLSVRSAGNTLSSQEPWGDPATLALGSSIQKSSFFSEIPLVSKGNSHPLSSTLKKRTSISSNSLLPSVWWMVLYLYLGAVVWARKYFYTSDMALRPSSLHLLNTYNLLEAVPCTGINKNKTCVCCQRDHSLT